MEKKDRDKNYLSDEECGRLLSVPRSHTRTGLRNATIMRILIEGGLKISELIGREVDGGEPTVSGAGPNDRGGLRIDDILWSQKAIVVRRHGERLVPLSSETMRLLKQWVYTRPSSESLLVFTTLQGGRLKNRYVRQFLSRYGREAGIGVPVKPSLLRTSFARRVQESGGDLAAVRGRLGLSPTTTPPRWEDDR